MKYVAALALLLVSATSVLQVSAAVAAPSRKKAAAVQDWTRTIVETAEGGYRMGNPKASIKLVEYASYSCPHCAHFAKEASVPIEAMVRQGRLSWEFRPFLLFPSDPGIAMLVRCQGPASSFRLAKQIFAGQDVWLARLQALPPERWSELQALPAERRIPAITQAAGMDSFFRERGMTPARISSCLTDQKGLDRLLEITSRGTSSFNVRGTPTFFVNGTLATDARSWDTLEPVIRRAPQ